MSQELKQANLFDGKQNKLYIAKQKITINNMTKASDEYSIPQLKKLLRGDKIKGSERGKLRGYLKTKLLSNVQQTFNKFIRYRDMEETENGLGSFCISCKTFLNPKEIEAGHFISRAASSYLRYHEDNVHAQCHRCNFFLSSNQLEYEIALRDKIGQERLDFLICNRTEKSNYTIEDLIAKGEYYRKQQKLIKPYDL